MITIMIGVYIYNVLLYYIILYYIILYYPPVIIHWFLSEAMVRLCVGEFSGADRRRPDGRHGGTHHPRGLCTLSVEDKPYVGMQDIRYLIQINI